MRSKDEVGVFPWWLEFPEVEEDEVNDQNEVSSF